jgi:hypothetical protein
MYHERYSWAVITRYTTVACCVLIFPVVSKNNVGLCRGYHRLKIDFFVHITDVVHGQQKLVKNFQSHHTVD